MSAFNVHYVGIVFEKYILSIGINAIIKKFHGGRQHIYTDIKHIIKKKIQKPHLLYIIGEGRRGFDTGRRGGHHDHVGGDDNVRLRHRLARLRQRRDEVGERRELRLGHYRTVDNLETKILDR